MSQIKVNEIYDASGGSAAKLYGPSMRYGGTAFVNRIINGDMRIDQRNNGAPKSVPAGAVTYLVDRFLWYAVGAGVTAQQVSGTGAYTNELLITGSAGNTANELWQRIESKNCADLKNQTVTLQIELSSNTLTSVNWSAEYANSVDNFGGTTVIASGLFAISSTPTIKTVSFNAGTNVANGLGVKIAFGAMGAGVTARITGVQLEAGTVASPFERRDYGRELMMCQRYYEQVSSQLSGMAYSAGNLAYSGKFQVNKRTTPTMSVVAQGVWIGNASSGSILAMTFSAVSNNAYNCDSVSFTGSVVQGYAYVVRDFIHAASAEL